MEATRRGFVTVGVAAGAALGMAGLMRNAKAETVEDPSTTSWDYETDFAVAGSGAGASLAIIQAVQDGNDVLVAEKLDWLGGTMRRSGGGIAAAETCVQKALGVEDSIDDFADYIVDCAEGICDEDMLRNFAQRANKDFDWFVQDIAGQTEADWGFADGKDGVSFAMAPGLSLSGNGTSFGLYGFRPVPRCYWFAANEEDAAANAVDRMYCPDLNYGRDTDKGNGGTGLYKPVEDFINDNGVQVLLKHALKSLITNNSGEVIGMVCTDLDSGESVRVKARKAVLIATGGYVLNDDMCWNFNLKGWENQPDKLFQITGLEIEGESDGAGILAAMAVGAGTALMGAGPYYGGLKTDLNAQVLDIFGEPIPRLYASSYAVAGKLGKNYPNCGLNNMWNMTYGRIAAEQMNGLEPWE